ncbi:MAG: diacylglycerol kinase family lipid kinase [Muribaculum sp.]|nr:diacylglycerol kinase family lipid kinase [Muribaculum sp.]
MTETRKILLIINPVSGTRPKDKVPGLVSDALSAEDADIITEITGSPEDAVTLAKMAVDQDFDKVIVAGGDGTINEVASTLVGSSVTLGIIPTGSGNGLARSLGLSQDFKKACDILRDGQTIRIDCGLANERPFFCTFGMGFDAAVTEKFAREKRRGRMSYVKSALIEFFKFHPNVYALSINGKIITERAVLVAVCNASQYGNNAYIAPKASLTDGLLDVTVIHDGPLMMQALAGIQLLSGQLDRNMLVDTFRISGADISRLDQGPAHIDGDLFYPGKVVNIKCKPSCLNVIAGADIYRSFHPITTPLMSFIQDLGADIRSVITT